MRQERQEPSLREAMPRVVNAIEAGRLVEVALAALDRLQPVIMEETAHLKAGQVQSALALESRKVEASRDYGLALQALKTNAIALGRFAPDGVALLRQRHDAFSDVLALNMAVLATARSVSEGLMRELAADVGRGRSPAGYDASGAASSAYARTAVPLAVSRTM